MQGAIKYSSVRNAATDTSQGGLSLYDVLEVRSDASDEEIKRSYFRLSKLYHPDANSSKEAKQLWQDLNEAYSILSNERTRRLYDSGIIKPDGEIRIPKDQVREYPKWEPVINPLAKKKKTNLSVHFDRKHLDLQYSLFMKNRKYEHVVEKETEMRKKWNKEGKDRKKFDIKDNVFYFVYAGICATVILAEHLYRKHVHEFAEVEENQRKTETVVNKKANPTILHYGRSTKRQSIENKPTVDTSL